MWTFFIAVVAVFLLIYRHLKQKYSIFKNLGINGPTPHLLFGNLADLRNLEGSAVVKRDIDMAKKYGKTFGYYQGGVPIIMTSDADFVQEVLVKQYNNFPGRRDHMFFPKPDAKEGVDLFISEGPRWKRLRTIANPMFTSARLKELVPTIHSCLSMFLQNIEQRFLSGEPFEIYKLYQMLTLDVISQTSFGLTTNCQKDPNDPVLHACEAVFHNHVGMGKIAALSIFFPEFPFWRQVFQLLKIVRAKHNPSAVLENMVKKVVEEMRSNNGIKVNSSTSRNFISMMLETELSGDVDLGSLHSFTKEDNEDSVVKVEKKLTSNEIVMQMVLFLLAGYETTSTTLAYATYLLSLNSDKQTKLADEIQQYITSTKKDSVSYEDLKNLKYLECVLKETLRLYPIAGTATTRRAKEDCIINGITVPANMVVQINAWAIHRDESFWGPDPDAFRPERHFEDQKHPMAWVPFGGGPRFCVGMRFALLEAKLALVALLRKYKFVPCKKTLEPLKLKAMGIVQPAEGIWISLEKR